jgi:acyl carrier protein
MKERIIEILSDIRPESDFVKSENFIEEGLLDSLDIVAFVESLEEEYDIEIPGTEISQKNFSSLDGIIELVKKYKQ